MDIFLLPNMIDFARICFNIFGDSMIRNLKKWKNTKIGLVPMSRQEKLADLFLVFPCTDVEGFQFL